MRDDVAISPRLLPRVSALLKCAAEDALDMVRALPMDPGGRWLTAPCGARLLLDVALPFRDGVAFRVSAVVPAPAAPAAAPTPTPARPTWSAVAALGAAVRPAC